LVDLGKKPNALGGYVLLEARDRFVDAIRALHPDNAVLTLGSRCG
jgi:hypothetical protein